MIRRVVALIGVATLVGWSVLPSVHIHVGQRSDLHDPAEGIIHAHWSAHQDIDFQITLRDGHGHRLLVDQQAIVAAPHTDRLAPTVSVMLPTAGAPVLSGRSGSRRSGASTRDGPPRGVSLLRAPPLVA